jgi:hypothetical protein
MPRERFPKRKYLRQLYDMEEELQGWRSHYLTAAELEWSVRASTAYTERAAVLADAAYRVLKAAEMVEGVPRLQ